MIPSQGKVQLLCSLQEKKNEGGIKGVNRKCLSQEVVSNILCRKGEQLYWDL